MELMFADILKEVRIYRAKVVAQWQNIVQFPESLSLHFAPEGKMAIKTQAFNTTSSVKRSLGETME